MTNKLFIPDEIWNDPDHFDSFIHQTANLMRQQAQQDLSPFSAGSMLEGNNNSLRMEKQMAEIGEQTMEKERKGENFSNSSPWAINTWIPMHDGQIQEYAHKYLKGNDKGGGRLEHSSSDHFKTLKLNRYPWLQQENAAIKENQMAQSDAFDAQTIRKDFPIFEKIPMVWLDNAATTQKPNVVIESMTDFLEDHNSNIHRGAHQWAKKATDLYEEARQTVAQFIQARSEKDIVFVRGATEAINLIANSFGEIAIQEGDEILISYLEHHSNILPWQVLAKRKGARLRVIPIDRHGDVLLDEYARLLSRKTKIVAITQVANSIGAVLPVKTMTEMAKLFGAYVLVDAAQSIPHLAVNVQDIGCDFLVFSGHKIYGPTGIGVAYIQEKLMNIMLPYQVGGGMIEHVTFEHSNYAQGRAKFEAGTPNVVGAIGLQSAIKYVQKIGLSRIAAYEKQLTDYAVQKLSQLTNLNFVGTPKERASVVSFVLDKNSNLELMKKLDENKIALRIGHHCAIPTVEFFGYKETIRPSIAFYNTREEIDLLYNVLKGLN